jgi:uncharacterized repeat protein (TIGR01451 family)
MAKYIAVKTQRRKARYSSALKLHHCLQITMLITLLGLIINPEIVVAQVAEINPRMDSKDDGGVTANPGDTVTYTLRYENTGLNDASGVVLTETVPTNTTFNAGGSTSGWVCNPNNNAGSICTLPVGFLPGNGRLASSVFAITIDNPLPPNVILISNTVTITADQDDDPTDNVASDTTPINTIADLSIVQSDNPDPVLPGGQLTYIITVNNGGPFDAQNVAVIETLPAGVTFLSTNGCAEDPNGVPICILGTVEAHGSAQFIVRVRVDLNATGTLTNNVSVTSSTNDPDSINNSSSEVTTISKPAEVPTATIWGTSILILLTGLASIRYLKTARQ